MWKTQDKGHPARMEKQRLGDPIHPSSYTTCTSFNMSRRIDSTPIIGLLSAPLEWGNNFWMKKNKTIGHSVQAANNAVGAML